jgi:3-methyladenine DNA glycosylase AlkC
LEWKKMALGAAVLMTWLNESHREAWAVGGGIEVFATKLQPKVLSDFTKNTNKIK